jgi:hypothetical protein
MKELAELILLLLWASWCTRHKLHFYFPNSYFVNTDQIINPIIIIRALKTVQFGPEITSSSAHIIKK